jgi:hypothetical protein
LEPKLDRVSDGAWTGHGVLADMKEKGEGHPDEIGDGLVLRRMVLFIPRGCHFDHQDRQSTSCGYGSWSSTLKLFKR